MTLTGEQWLAAFAAKLGTPVPTGAEIETLLALGALWVAWSLLRPKRGAHSRHGSGGATPAAVP